LGLDELNRIRLNNLDLSRILLLIHKLTS
jgi:hypothetical protein